MGGRKTTTTWKGTKLRCYKLSSGNFKWLFSWSYVYVMEVRNKVAWGDYGWITKDLTYISKDLGHYAGIFLLHLHIHILPPLAAPTF